MPLEKHKRIAIYIVMIAAIAAVLCISAALISSAVEKNIYKMSYESKIHQCSEKYALSESLIEAVIFTESSWENDALSPKGAVGLMQIMPETGAWIAEKNGEEPGSFKTERLYESETNIEYGCWYLRFLLDKYDNNIKYALIAYNAGPGNLDKWLKDPVYTKDGALNTIPFPQTADYIDKVYSAKEKYEEIYSEQMD